MQTTAEHTDAAPASGPERADHFETLGLPRKLGLDAAALKRAFHDLSRRHHPDLVHEQGPEARDRAVALATRINDAFTCLKDRLRRAEHLLALEGRLFESKTDQIPPRFFDLVMEINMAAAEAKGGDAGALRTLARLAAKLEGEEARALAALGEAEAAWDAAADAGAEGAARGAAADRLQAALKEIFYLRRLRGTVDAATETPALP